MSAADNQASREQKQTLPKKGSPRHTGTGGWARTILELLPQVLFVPNRMSSSTAAGSVSLSGQLSLVASHAKHASPIAALAELSRVRPLILSLFSCVGPPPPLSLFPGGRAPRVHWRHSLPAGLPASTPVTALAALTCGNLRCRRGGLGERAHSGKNCILVLTGCPPGLG